MSPLAVVLALFINVRVLHSDLSRVQMYPPSQHAQPSPAGDGRVPPLPAAPLPDWILMTAASTGEFQPDNDLEVTHEFKLHIGASREICLFQKVRENARLYISFRVGLRLFVLRIFFSSFPCRYKNCWPVVFAVDAVSEYAFVYVTIISRAS